MLSRGTRISIFGFVCAFAHNCRLPINMSYYRSRAEACGSLFSSWAAVLVVKVVVIASRVAFHYTLLMVHSNSTDGSRWHSLFELTKPQYFLFCFCLYRRRCGCVHWAERRCFVQSSRPHVTSEQPFCPSFETSLLPLLPIFPSPFFTITCFLCIGRPNTHWRDAIVTIIKLLWKWRWPSDRALSRYIDT